MKYLMLSLGKESLGEFDHLHPAGNLRERAKIDEYLHWNDTGLRIGTNRYVFLKYLPF